MVVAEAEAEMETLKHVKTETPQAAVAAAVEGVLQ